MQVTQAVVVEGDVCWSSETLECIVTFAKLLFRPSWAAYNGLDIYLLASRG
jgi:hypothetical protein